MHGHPSGNSEFDESDIQRSHKMDALARLASRLSHEYNNLLTVILGHVDLMMAAPDVNAVADSAAEIRASVFRGAQLGRQLMAFSQRMPVTMQDVDLNEVVIGAQPMLKRLVGEQITVQTGLDARAPMIRADVGQLEHALSQLASNARDAMPAGGVLHLATRVMYTERDGEAVQWVALAITDSGVGMDEQTKARIFEPFFTTKPSGEGKGLGLATVYGIVNQAGGRIQARSEPSLGTTFEMVFPAI
jgi:signal transduction histidine kinase